MINYKARFIKGGIDMYEYKFVETSMGGIFTEDNHCEIINEHAKEGWRLVQVMPCHFNMEGRPNKYEIIFEREVGDRDKE